MAAGLSGTVTVSSASNVGWGKVNANAVKVATLTSDNTKAVIFGYENGGATMQLWWLLPGRPDAIEQIIPSSDLLAPSAVTANSTIYIEGMYEEDITPGSTTTQYTSYYTFGGKVVGMRRVVGATSTQYRMVTDHLGSTSLIVDAQNTPMVVQRTYNKPYGEVAWSWSSSGGGPTSPRAVLVIGA